MIDIIKLDLIILSICSFFVIITAIKFFRGNELRDRIVGFGLINIAIALILGSVFNFYSLFEGIYWAIVEVFHAIGIILITMGVSVVYVKKKGLGKK